MICALLSVRRSSLSLLLHPPIQVWTVSQSAPVRGARGYATVTLTHKPACLKEFKWVRPRIGWASGLRIPFPPCTCIRRVETSHIPVIIPTRTVPTPSPSLLDDGPPPCPLRSCSFVDVKAAVAPPGGAANGGVYALTSSGSLILMRAAGRTIDKSVNLQARDLARERMGLGIRLFRSLRT